MHAALAPSPRSQPSCAWLVVDTGVLRSPFAGLSWQPRYVRPTLWTEPSPARAAVEPLLPDSLAGRVGLLPLTVPTCTLGEEMRKRIVAAIVCEQCTSGRAPSEQPASHPPPALPALHPLPQAARRRGMASERGRLWASGRCTLMPMAMT